MRLLLDTHAFLWFVLDDPRLPSTSEAFIVDPDNGIDVSAATCWEIAIKVSLCKYHLSEPHEAFMEREFANNRFRLLPIQKAYGSTDNITVSPS